MEAEEGLQCLAAVRVLVILWNVSYVIVYDMTSIE